MRRLAPLLCLAFAACDRAVASAPTIASIGLPGSSDGHFATPRAAAWDPQGRLYVVDKTGRVQRFDASGRFERVWRTPAIEKGRPTGLTVDPHGNVVVADTHYHRLLRYSPEGELLQTIGTTEGTSPGQFIYPVGLAIARDGTIYVSEYGGNDRIQVFSADGRLLRGWGRYGEANGEFKRPQGLALSGPVRGADGSASNGAGDRLYVADAANHRIQVFTTEGAFVATWGDVRYPYSVAVDADGHVLVAEYGRHRVAKFRADGTPLAVAGTAGSGPGQLDTPWGAVPAGDRVFVVDSGNHRVQIWPCSVFRDPSP